jgi:hypothetical protein
VITLVPKGGDKLDIKNWRPITLLNTDYKIFAKVLTTRLKSVMTTIIHPDQTYCTPSRSIHNNLHLIRDVIWYSNKYACPLGIISVDQEKAFDHVSHDYLFHTLQKLSFPQSFLSAIQTLYKNNQSLLKIGEYLSAPFPLQRGIRQGDPLSGLLFSISLEPFLHFLRRQLACSAFHSPLTSYPLIVSAYADDITVFYLLNLGLNHLVIVLTYTVNHQMPP